MVGLAWIPTPSEPGSDYRFSYRPMPDFAAPSLASPVSGPYLSPNPAALRSRSLRGPRSQTSQVTMSMSNALVSVSVCHSPLRGPGLVQKCESPDHRTPESEEALRKP